MVKRIQNTMIQALTDAINLLLIDKGLDSYVDRFQIRMQTPTTQEEVDRRENMSSKVGLTRDVMDMLGDIEDTEVKLKILKSLLSNVISNTEVTTLIQQEIDRLAAIRESQENPEGTDSEELISTEDSSIDTTEDDLFSMDGFEASDIMSDGSEDTSFDGGSEEVIAPIENTEDNYLPSPEELGQDMTKIEG